MEIIRKFTRFIPSSKTHFYFLGWNDSREYINKQIEDVLDGADDNDLVKVKYIRQVFERSKR